MSEQKKEQPKQSTALEELLTKIVEQNTTLIQQIANKDQIILAALEQNNELLLQLSEQESEQPRSRTLD
ncbi:MULTISPECIES: hypothetical protein [unclassified Acinetobacter]|uniref:hypothetical protein n=1 Tax=unclassified Acinetobacter TaxID=196816 RepID=UPI0025BC60F2|nr:MULTISPECIES: hypothetical protein [unclassified Acinetobacter]